MADEYQFPTELVDLQRAFFAAEAHLSEVLKTLPAPMDIANGEAEISPEQREQSDAAWEELRRLAEQLSGHTFWSALDNPVPAKRALQRLART